MPITSLLSVKRHSFLSPHPLVPGGITLRFTNLNGGFESMRVMDSNMMIH
jgi:hypothetical protein